MHPASPGESPPPREGIDRTERTYRLELRRALTNGVLESAGSTFLLIIALSWFHAGSTAKALVAAGGSVGLMCSPLVVFLVAKLRWPAALGAARLAAVGAVSFVIMFAFPVLWVFVTGSIVSMAAASAAIPLMTQVYQENYPEDKRGKLFSRTVMVRIATAAAFSHGAGRLLNADISYSRGLLLAFASAFAIAWRLLRAYPSQPLAMEAGMSPFRGLRFVREDRLFRLTLICWMLMGFANLMMLPLRIEYLGNKRYGLALQPAEIAFLTSVVPNMARLAMSQVWGWLFDRTNFFILRVTLNAGFALSILTFFLSDSITGLVAGAVIYGVSNSGGDVAWGLWVTKFSPPDRVADYMSVHTFFTGLRGVIAPVAAFHLIERFTMGSLGWMCAGLIVAASLLMLPEIHTGANVRKSSALSEEVSE